MQSGNNNENVFEKNWMKYSSIIFRSRPSPNNDILESEISSSGAHRLIARSRCYCIIIE